MQPTSISLLELLKDQDDQGSWTAMVELYQPLIKKWLTRFGAPASELDDLAQSVLVVVVRRLPDFQHSGHTGAFRSWMRTIAKNCLLEFWRQKRIHPVATGKSTFQQQLEQLSDDQSELSRIWQQEYDDEVLKAVLNRIRNEFQRQTWEAFRLVAIEGMAAKDAAQQLGLSTNGVFIAKSRIMTRLRLVGKEILD